MTATVRGVPAAALVAAAGGALLVAAPFLPWSSRGPGSTISLRGVADLVLSGRIDAFVPRWVGLVVYAVPVGGALLLIGAGVGGRPGTVVAAAGCLVATAGTVLAGAAVIRLDEARPGGGVAVAVAGAILGVLGTALTLPPRRRSDPPHPQVTES